MQTAAHTPGPWEIRQSRKSLGGTEPFVYAVGYEFPVCTVTGYFEGAGQTLPNLRLLAAAPELLAALQGVVRVADRATVEFDAARAAIAKVVGGAQ